MGMLLVFHGLCLIGQMAINLSGGQMLVSQQFLNFSEICPTIDQMSGIRMPEGMRTRTLVEARPADVAVKDLADRAI